MEKFSENMQRVPPLHFGQKMWIFADFQRFLSNFSEIFIQPILARGFQIGSLLVPIPHPKAQPVLISQNAIVIVPSTGIPNRIEVSTDSPPNSDIQTLLVTEIVIVSGIPNRID